MHAACSMNRAMLLVGYSKKKISQPSPVAGVATLQRGGRWRGDHDVLDDVSILACQQTTSTNSATPVVNVVGVEVDADRRRAHCRSRAPTGCRHGDLRTGARGEQPDGGDFFAFLVGQLRPPADWARFLSSSALCSSFSSSSGACVRSSAHAGKVYSTPLDADVSPVRLTRSSRTGLLYCQVAPSLVEPQALRYTLPVICPLFVRGTKPACKPIAPKIDLLMPSRSRLKYPAAHCD